MTEKEKTPGCGSNSLSEAQTTATKASLVDSKHRNTVV